MIDKGTLIIDKSRLTYMGDVLHEAGHIALMNPWEREHLTEKIEGQSNPKATEMAVIATIPCHQLLYCNGGYFSFKKLRLHVSDFTE